MKGQCCTSCICYDYLVRNPRRAVLFSPSLCLGHFIFLETREYYTHLTTSNTSKDTDSMSNCFEMGMIPSPSMLALKADPVAVYHPEGLVQRPVVSVCLEPKQSCRHPCIMLSFGNRTTITCLLLLCFPTSYKVVIYYSADALCVENLTQAILLIFRCSDRYVFLF